MLDPFGFITTATCATCGVTPTDHPPLSGADREAAFLFVDEHEAALGWEKGDRAVLHDIPLIVTFTSKRTDFGWTTIARHKGRLVIRGHEWPNRPTSQTMDPDSLKEQLRGMYEGSDVTYELFSTYFAARTEAGPLELRQAACWMSLGDVPSMPIRHVVGRGAARPCFDARTGEDLTGLEIGWTIEEAKDGTMTRRVFRPTPPAIGGYRWQ